MKHVQEMITHLNSSLELSLELVLVTILLFNLDLVLDNTYAMLLLLII